MPAPAQCEPNLPATRRVFWTTQPDACGIYNSCDDRCGIPGLKYIDEAEGRRISNQNWVTSLVLNILNTRAREPKAKCGNQLVGIGGHWSESYRSDGLYTGTRIWAEAQQTFTKIQDAVGLLNAQIQSDVGKLIKMGVATDVEVTTEYVGKNKVVSTILIYGPSIGNNTISLTGERLTNEWAWRG